MADDTTPDGKRLALARRQAGREELVRNLRRAQREEVPPDWDDTEEPSKVTIVGPAAEAFVARGSLFARAKHSLAPISERMSSPKGKAAALITLVVSAVVAAILKELMGQ
jgi:hypothetical protein